MINIFRKNKKASLDRLRTSRDFQKLLKPSPDFVRRTGFLFLSVFSQKFGRDPRPANPRAFRYFLRGLASGVAFMLIISGGAAYADQKNVGPDNLLYPLKRAQEVVNLTLSNAEEKPILHLKLAERRLEEIEEVKQKDPSSGKISGLSDDFREELRNLVGALNGDEIEDEDLEDENAVENEIEHEDIKSETSGQSGNLTTSTQGLIQTKKKPFSRRQVFTEKSAPSICTSFRTLIPNHSAAAQQAIGENSKLLTKFEKKCLPILREILKADDQTKSNQGEQEISKVEENKNLRND